MLRHHILSYEISSYLVSWCCAGWIGCWVGSGWSICGLSCGWSICWLSCSWSISGLSCGRGRCRLYYQKAINRMSQKFASVKYIMYSYEISSYLVSRCCADWIGCWVGSGWSICWLSRGRNGGWSRGRLYYYQKATIM